MAAVTICSDFGVQKNKVSHCFRCLPFIRHSLVWVCSTLRTVACQASLSMGFSSQKYYSRLPCLPPWALPDPGIESGSPALQADSLPLNHQRSPIDGLRNTKWTYFKIVNKQKKVSETRSTFENSKLTAVVWVHLKNWKRFSKQTWGLFQI